MKSFRLSKPARIWARRAQGAQRLAPKVNRQRQRRAELAKLELSNSAKLSDKSSCIGAGAADERPADLGSRVSGGKSGHLAICTSFASRVVWQARARRVKPSDSGGVGRVWPPADTNLPKRAGAGCAIKQFGPPEAVSRLNQSAEASSSLMNPAAGCRIYPDPSLDHLESCAPSSGPQLGAARSEAKPDEKTKLPREMNGKRARAGHISRPFVWLASRP